MKRARVLLITLALTAALLPSAWAQDDDLAALYGDEEFISIATGSKKPITKAPAVASVITAEDIKAMGATTLDQALETVPGLHVSLSTLSRLDSVYSIRGIHTGFNPQVLILMNGISFPELWSSAHPILFRLPVANIERIEIIRGPGSAVYGADAFAGVINIITKEAADISGTQIGGRTGSFDTQDLWLQHGDTYAGWDVVFSFEWQTTDGDRDRVVKSDAQTALDAPDAFGTSASLAPGALDTRYEVLNTHLNIERGNWRFHLWNWRLEDAGLGAGAAQALDPKGSQSDNLYLTDLTWHNTDLHPDWDLTTRVSYQYLDNDIDFNLLPAGTTLLIGSDGNINFTNPAGVVSFPAGLLARPDGTSEIAGLDQTLVYSGFDNHSIRIGAGIKRQELDTQESKNFGPGIIDGTEGLVDGTMTNVSNTPYVYAPDKSRKVTFLSLQDEWQFAPDWELTAGIRYDDFSDTGDTVNPRMALVWATRHNLTTKLLYGTAFRAPSFSELYAVNNPVAQGNSHLEPETIDTLELAFDYKPTLDLQFGLSLFAYEAKDLIEFVPDQNGTSRTAQNARDQDGHGFELEMDWKVTERLRFRGNYVWQHSEDKKTNKRIADAPGQQAYLKADWKFLPAWTFSPQATWVGNRVRATSDPRPEIDDYTLVDLTLRRNNLYKNLDVALSAHNVFDEDAHEPSDGTIPDDYPLEGRSVWFEMIWRM
ncbi:TonB-dependent receptor plug domain-containing protein [Trichloromonas sp.]|uniref:TonB-dependent receptor plug domain-containing protein n=1 Tax=Trichloromonas sp. TaxID=3069249 RepID=UPI003D8171FB